MSTTYFDLDSPLQIAEAFVKDHDLDPSSPDDLAADLAGDMVALSALIDIGSSASAAARAYFEDSVVEYEDDHQALNATTRDDLQALAAGTEVQEIADEDVSDLI